jgi:hypothetical protein
MKAIKYVYIIYSFNSLLSVAIKMLKDGQYIEERGLFGSEICWSENLNSMVPAFGRHPLADYNIVVSMTWQ